MAVQVGKKGKKTSPANGGKKEVQALSQPRETTTTTEVLCEKRENWEKRQVIAFTFTWGRKERTSTLAAPIEKGVVQINHFRQRVKRGRRWLVYCSTWGKKDDSSLLHSEGGKREKSVRAAFLEGGGKGRPSVRSSVIPQEEEGRGGGGG